MTVGMWAAMGTVFTVATFSFWTSIPAGMALQLHPALAVLAATVSYGVGVALIVIVGAPLRDRIAKRMQGRRSADSGEPAQPGRLVQMAEQAWARFGLVGLSLLAPITVGGHIGAVIALSFGARPVPMITAMTIGAAVWGVVIAAMVSMGLGIVIG